MDKIAAFLTFTLPLQSAQQPPTQTQPPAPAPIVQQLKVMPTIGIVQSSGVRFK